MYRSVLKSTLTLLIIGTGVGLFISLGGPAQFFPAGKSSASLDSPENDLRGSSDRGHGNKLTPDSYIEY
jgi:hypothetical protein